jgi:mRNA interferase HicA
MPERKLSAPAGQTALALTDATEVFKNSLRLHRAPVMKYSEFKRWLERQGVHCRPGKGSHLHVELNGRHSIFPLHGAKEIPVPLVNAIKKDLGLK